MAGRALQLLPVQLQLLWLAALTPQQRARLQWQQAVSCEREPPQAWACWPHCQAAAATEAVQRAALPDSLAASEAEPWQASSNRLREEPAAWLPRA